jgi:hypothetical protein
MPAVRGELAATLEETLRLLDDTDLHLPSPAARTTVRSEKRISGLRVLGAGGSRVRNLGTAGDS